MAAGTPGIRKRLLEPQEITGPASGRSRARISDGRTRDGLHRAHGGPTRDDGSGSTRWNTIFQVLKVVNGEPAELVMALIPMGDTQVSFQILHLFAAFCLSHLLRTIYQMPSCCRLRLFGEVNVGVYYSWRSSFRGRALNSGGSSPRSHRVPKPYLPGIQGPTADPPAHLRRRP